MSNYGDSHQPLGIGAIISDSFSIFFQRFWLMFVLALLPAVIQYIVQVLVPQPGNEVLRVDPTAVVVPVLVTIAAQLVIYSLSNSLIVIAAFDAKIGRPGRLSVYVQWALTNVVTVLVLTIALTLLMIVPFLVLFAIIYLLATMGASGLVGVLTVVVGLACGLYSIYLWAGFSPLVPAIVIEGAGFGAMRRAWNLSRGYRWRIVGVMLVLGIIVAVIGWVGILIGSLLGPLSIIVALAMNAVIGGIFAIGLAMIYARLRGIKEGLDVESLADVFS